MVAHSSRSLVSRHPWQARWAVPPTGQPSVLCPVRAAHWSPARGHAEGSSLGRGSCSTPVPLEIILIFIVASMSLGSLKSRKE